MENSKLPKFHWAKLLSVFFFLLLLGAYANIFAIGIYAPGETLDPTCTPGSLDCTVNIGSGSSGWGLVGNSGTSIGTDFIGTTDDVDLQFRRNNIVAGQIGDSNTSFGLAALFSNTTGSQNTATGAGVLFFNTTGSQNTANGFSALSGNTTGFANTASGDNSLSFNTTGNHNTANGAGALIFNTTGNFNAALGYAAGMYIANDIIGNSTSNNSVYLGYDTRASADGNHNEIVIGANTIGNGSNTATIGNTSTLRTYLTGLNLKAGTATAGTAPLKLTSGINLSTTEAGAIEYDGSHLYFTATNGGSRYQLDQQGGGMSIGGAITSATQGSILFAGAGGVLAQNNTNFNWNNGTLQFTLGGNILVDGGSLTYLNNTGLIDIANTTDFTGVAGETSIGLKIKPVLTVTEPASGTFTHYGQVIDLSGISISDGAGFSEVSGLSIIGSNDGGVTITSGIDISSVASNASDQIGLSIGSGWDKGIKFYESDSVGGTETDYISINAPASVTTSYDLIFPSAQGGVNTYLKNDGSGGLSWTTVSGGLLSDADFNTKGGTDAGLNFVAGAGNNTFLGYEAGKGGVVTIAADNNTAIGYRSLYSITTGNNNSAQGANSLFYSTTGSQNTAQGVSSLYSNTTGFQNTAHGFNSLYFNTTGNWNTANGTNSLYSNITGSYNTSNGNNSLYSNKAGSNGVAIGKDSQYYVRDTATPWTNRNTSVGYQSLQGSTIAANNTGNGNTALGYQSLFSNTTGGSNSAQGYRSLYSNTTGYFNTTQGTDSMFSNTTGYENTAQGFLSLYSNTTGNSNSAQGINSLNSNTTGSNNSAQGAASLQSNTTGGENTAQGMSSLASNITGYRNSAQGYNSLSGNTIGGDNSAIGYFAGSYIADGLTFNTSSDYSIYLGADTKALADDGQNEIVIGYNTIGNGSNTATIGNTSLLRTYLTGVNLKAGTATAGTAPLKFNSGTLLGTTEAGAIEYDGSHLYFTATSAGTRYQLDQQGGGTPAITVVNTSNLFSTGLSGTGSGVTTVTYSNFLGESAGSTATSASNSNFLGYYAGLAATSASNSNFLGKQSGVNATLGSDSNFFGQFSGWAATNASNSNFLGKQSGESAANASNSNFLGYWSGRSAINASNSIFIGQKAGSSDTVNNTGNIDDFSILIGKDTTTGGFSNSIALGGSARNTATNQFVIGSTTRPIDTTVVYGSASTQCTLTTGVGVSCTSDERLKTNITNLSTDTLDKLIQIKTVNFNWKEGNNNTNNIGFLAQDLEQYFPEMVATNAEGYKSVYYSNMTPIIVEAIRELDLKVKDFSSLDTTIATSLGSMIKEFIENEVNRFEKIFAKTIVTEGIQMKDTITGEDYCVVISNGEFEKIKGKCGEAVVQTESEDGVETEISEVIPEIDPTDDIPTDETDVKIIIEEVQTDTELIEEEVLPAETEENIEIEIPPTPQEDETVTL